MPLLNSAVGRAAYVGRLSYPLYLWHWQVLVLCKWTVGLNDALVRLKALGVTLALAMATYHLLEAPFRAWPLERVTACPGATKRPCPMCFGCA